MSVKRFALSPQANQDVQDILAYHSAHSAAYAAKAWRLLLACFRRVGRQPKAGADRGHLMPGLRNVVVDRKYLVFFRREGRTTQIVRVMNGVRNITASAFAP